MYSNKDKYYSLSAFPFAERLFSFEGKRGLTELTVNSCFFLPPPRVPYIIINIYILIFICVGVGVCIFGVLTVNLLTLPLFRAYSMLPDDQLIELGGKKL